MAKRLPDATLDSLESLAKDDAHVYIPSPVLLDLLRGYRRYVALTGDQPPVTPTPSSHE